MKRSQAKVTEKSEQKTEEPNSKKARSSEAVEVKVEVKEEINNGEHDHETEMENENAAAVNFVVKKEERKKCPYLDTVNRQLLDFDMEKVCSVTLSNLNVYCCLICGKYFQGRGKSTPAYTHSVASGQFSAHHTHAICLSSCYSIIKLSLLYNTTQHNTKL
jgi:U4/U6.U5 tri-snRNP-associated protein 2